MKDNAPEYEPQCSILKNGKDEISQEVFRLTTIGNTCAKLP